MTKPRILLVDDEAPMREILSLYFRAKGMEVTTAANGHEARELLHKSPFDLTILDLNLGGEDALEILGFLKTRWPDRPVIVFTGAIKDVAFLKKSMPNRPSSLKRYSQRAVRRRHSNSLPLLPEFLQKSHRRSSLR